MKLPFVYGKAAKQRLLFIAAIFCLGCSAQAHDAALLNQALESSDQERAGLDHEYKSNRATERAANSKSDVKAISLELGDELGGSSGGGPIKTRSKDKVYRERAVAQKLEKEWKDVNRSLSNTLKISSKSEKSKSSSKTTKE